MIDVQKNEVKPIVPEKFLNPESGEINLEALLGSYKELERKLSTVSKAPDTEEGRARMLRSLGVPDTHEDYDLDVSHGLFGVDPEVNKRLHAAGCTCDQVQEVYNLAAEKLVPVILEILRDAQADREVERLITEFGGHEKWREISRQLLAFGKKNLPSDALEHLSGSYEGVMALYRLMKGQEPGIGFRGNNDTGSSSGEADLRTLVRDPRYWRDKDPSVVAKVTEGFQLLYAGKQ